MSPGRLWAGVLAVAITAAACAPAARGPTPSPDGQGAAPAAPKSLTVALDFEPVMIVWNIGATRVKISDELRMALHQPLSGYNDRGEVLPMLAAEVPSPDRGTWVVNADGSMRTTYKLRPGVKWHDGTPLTAQDFVLGWSVMRDPEVPSGDRGTATQITRIETPDDLTLVLDWRSTYPFADALVKNEVGPMPAHLLEAQYQADKNQFTLLPYWSRDFVGVGMYRLSEWEAGSHMVLKGIDDHFARPKIDTMTVKFIASHDTLVANMLAGSVDVSPRILKTAQAMLVKEQWEQQGRKPVAIVQSHATRSLRVQFRDARLPEVADVRARRALLQAIDRQSLAEVTNFGLAPAADGFLPPSDPRWNWVKDAVVRYSHDPRQAQAALLQLGWRPGPDGALLNQAGEKLTIPLRSGDTPEDDAVQSIIGDNWKRAGIVLEQDIRPQAELRDREFSVTFPALSLGLTKTDFSALTQMAYGPECPTAQNRWVGSNDGCYQNPALDRAVEGLRGTIDRGAQQSLYRDYSRLLSEDLPLIPLYHTTGVALGREGLTGMKGETAPPTSVFWNISEWDIR